jgi:23S rRNA pseudouridine2605 synthase
MTTPKTNPKTKKPSKAKKSATPKPDAIAVESTQEPVAASGAAFEAEVEVAAIEEAVAEKDVESAGDSAKADAAISLEDEDGPEAGFTPQPRPPAKLERLQKILAAAGVASRRSAEGMIEQGRVQVNGKVVTTLGTKADAGRDHIRVDGKLLQGAERLRYFVLNKPKGFVTTVKDPEGRPTVMQFFDKMKERLYPVGRLDYMSEGLLVVTNDGELANKLTKASSGVEKTYLVKVAGQPTEAELDILRGGVSIALGKPGSRTIRTSPARIRQVRQGDNPWYEVVLIEGRNRELRKMFEEVGHFVEKIRRTGYGPLVLDQEPGNLRELEPSELEQLRLAAEGKLRTPKSKDLRRRNLLDAGLLPTVLPKPSGRPRPATPFTAPPADAPRSTSPRPTGFHPKKFGADRPSRPNRAADSFASGAANKLFRPARPGAEGFRPAAGRTSAPNPVRSFSRSEDDRPRRTGKGAPANFGTSRPSGRSFDPGSDRPNATSSARPPARPAWKKDDRPAPPRARFVPTGADRPFTAKPAWKKPERPARPEFKRTARPDFKPSGKPGFKASTGPDFKRSAPPRREAPVRNFDDDLGPVRPPNLHIEEITGTDRPSYSRPPASRPFRSEGALPRPFTTSSGKPRPGGARSSSKPGRPPRPGSKPFTERKTGSGWKPKPSFGAGKPASGARSNAKPGGFSSSGYKAKPSGKRPGGRPGGKKRG